MLVQRVHNGRQILQRELPITVSTEDQVACRGFKPRPQRPSVTQIRGVRNYPHARVVLGDVTGNRGRVIGRPVIDNDDLKVVGNTRQVLQRVADHSLDVLRLVVARKENAD